MQQATYVRIYTDAEGETHFEDITLDLFPIDFAPPADPMNVAQFLPTAKSYWVGASVGWSGEEPHPSPRRQIMCIMQGIFEVTVSDGEVRQLPAGTVVLVEDTWGKGHQTKIVSGGNALMFGIALADQ